MAGDLRDMAVLGFEHAPDATLVLADRVIVAANHRVLRAFGWPAAELLGQSIRMLYPAQTDYDLIGARALRAMQSDPVYTDERFMRRKDGHVIWMAASGQALDRAAPHRLAVWTYRPLETGQIGGDPALTAAEKRVAGYLVNGFTSKEIAQSIGCSPRTVEAHRASMIRKLKVRNSFDLVSRLLSAGPQA